MHPTARRAAACSWLILVLALVGLAGATSAAAHAELVRSNPADGTNLARSPQQLRLELSESVELKATTVTVTDGRGRNVPTTGIRLLKRSETNTERPSTLLVGIPQLPPGQYRVSWRTLSSDDLHVTSGVFVFGVQHAVRAAVTAPPEPRPSVPESTVRWLGLLGLGLCLGSITLLLLMGPRWHRPELPSTTSVRLLTVATCGAAAALCAAAALPILQARSAGGPILETLRRLLLHERYGSRWFVYEAALLALLVGCAVVRLRTRRGARLREGRLAIAVVVPSTVAVTASTLLTHVGVRAASHPGLVAAHALHVLAAITWAGAVAAAALVLLGRRPGVPWLRTLVLRRFGMVAAACLAVMVVTGLVLAGAEIATPDALLHSIYGRALLVKVAVGVLAGLLGLLHTVALRPGLASRLLHRSLPPDLLRRTLPVEALLVVGALAVAAVLASSQPARGQRWAAVDPPVRIRSAAPADLRETVRVQPNRPGSNFVTIDIFDSRRPSPGPVQQVLVTLSGPDGSTAKVPAVHLDDGSWVVAGYDMRQGSWRVQVSALRAGLPPATASYRWTVPGPGVPIATGLRGTSLAGLTTFLAISFVVVVAGLCLAGMLLVRRLRRHDQLPDASRSPADLRVH